MARTHIPIVAIKSDSMLENNVGLHVHCTKVMGGTSSFINHSF